METWELAKGELVGSYAVSTSPGWTPSTVTSWMLDDVPNTAVTWPPPATTWDVVPVASVVAVIKTAPEAS